MTHYYLLIVAGPTLDDTTEFYKVGVGISKQGTRDFLYLTALAAQRNYYFKLWSQEVADFFHRVHDSLFHTNNSSAGSLTRLQVVPARALVRHFKMLDSISLSQTVLRQRDRFLKNLNLNYRIISNLRKS